MTIIKRRRQASRPDADESGVSGVRYSCDSCSADVTNSVRLRCSQLDAASNTPVCEEFDLCGSCFCAGAEVGRHRRWHDYRVVERHARPIYAEDWGADEELLLIDACQTYGLGNWADIADHIGSYRTRDEVAEHYVSTYVLSPDFPYPPNIDTDAEAFQARKKRRLEVMRQRPPPPVPPKPLASGPTCHEVGGFMPGRLEFEHEFENEAETLVKDMEFGLVHRYGGDEQPSQVPVDAKKVKAEEVEGARRILEAEPFQGDALVEEEDDDLELKLAVLDIFNERYDRRLDSKELVFERALTDYKRLQANERKRPKDERELLNRVKAFARVQTAADYEVFVDGLLHEMALRKRIAELQEFRRMGLSTFPDVDKYEKDKLARTTAARSAVFSYDRSAVRSARPAAPRANAYPLTLSNSSSLQLVSDAERQLCAELRILPRPYLLIKECLLREYARRQGRLSRAEARALFRFDGAKVDRIFDFVIV